MILMLTNPNGTGSYVIAGGEKKNFIVSNFKPQCVEMEGCSIAHACYVNKVPFVIIRCMSDTADDLLFDGANEIWFAGERINTKNTHGTGCTLSSSLAANLAKGMSLTEAVKASKAYVTEAIAYGIELGAGCGPTHHFVDLYRKAGILEK